MNPFRREPAAAGPPGIPDAVPAPAPELLSMRVLLALLAAWTVAMLAISLGAHPTPLYFVETDLLGEYIPAAREILAGSLSAIHYSYKGPGYPLLLALFSAPFGGDLFLGARVLSVLASAAAAAIAWRLVRGIAGGAVGAFVLLGMLLAPAFVRYAIEAGTDAPAAALALASAALVLRAPSPRNLLLAGLLAGFATLTRPNAAFLAPAALAVLLSRPNRARTLASFALGLAAPLAAWAAVTAKLGGAPHDRNYLNLAYELYGNDMTWDRFEAEIGSRFGSLRSVLAYDPLYVLARIGSNLAVHRLRDARELVPLWIGVFALPGLAALAASRAWRRPLAFAALAALTLAPVFYNARFALFLLPFELAAAALALLWICGRLRLARLAPVAACVLLAASGLAAGRALQVNLAEAPHETRWAGLALRRLGVTHGRILSRKPHVGYFAGIETAPLPGGTTLADLLADARRERAEFVFYSALERNLRPEYAILSDSALTLPGITQVLWGRFGERFAAIYRVSGSAPDSAALANATRERLTLDAARPQATPEERFFAALQLSRLGAPAAALEVLDALAREGYEDSATHVMRSNTLLALGRLDESYAACERAMAIGPATASHWARLGEIRGRERRFVEARGCYEHAVTLEPAHVLYLERLGLACYGAGDPAGAAAAFERCVRLAPRDVRLRRYAMGAWERAGNPRRMRELYDQGLRAGISASALNESASAPR